MSRTDKDLPYGVKVLHLMKDGHFNHDHNRDRPRTVYVECEETFEKKDARTIHAFRQELIAEGVEFVEVELDAVVKTYIDNDYRLSRIVEIPKSIEFRWKKAVRVKSRVSAYCSSPEFYDPLTGLDTRDNKDAACVPTVEDYSGGGYYWCMARSPHSRNGLKSRLNNIARDYNSGLEIDDDDVVIGTYWLPGKWEYW